MLGQGAGGEVRKCTHKETGLKYTVKCLNMGLIRSKKALGFFREEVAVIRQFDHPNVIQWKNVYEHDTNIYVIEDYLKGDMI